MLTKILNTNLDRTNFLDTIKNALLGTWGNENQENSNIIYIGRIAILFSYSGSEIINPSKDYKAISIIKYTDNTEDILSVEKGGTLSLNKDITVAITIAQLL